jgi:hypothetical protein
MNSSDLTPEQCKIIGDRLRPILRYLHALRNRVQQQAFPQDDKVRRLVEAAHDNVHHLSVELHYLGIRSGVGRPSRD